MSGPDSAGNAVPTLTATALPTKGTVMATAQPTHVCRWCKAIFVRYGKKTPVFCSRKCKGEWQRTQKPVDREWLHQKYVVEELSTYQIGKLVSRDPKQVWRWIKDYGIPLREREWSIEPDLENRPYQHPGWLWVEYFFNGRSAEDIAQEFGVDKNNIYHFLKKAGIPRRTMSESRAIKHWGAEGPANPMFGIRGAAHPNWKGGNIPERLAFYSSYEWRKAFKAVWKRDRERCQHCEITYQEGATLEVHHIVPFAVVELRAVVSNLVLLCTSCHDFVHGKENTKRLFLEGEFQSVY